MERKKRVAERESKKWAAKAAARGRGKPKSGDQNKLLFEFEKSFLSVRLGKRRRQLNLCRLIPAEERGERERKTFLPPSAQLIGLAHFFNLSRSFHGHELVISAFFEGKEDE